MSLTAVCTKSLELKFVVLFCSFLFFSGFVDFSKKRDN